MDLEQDVKKAMNGIPNVSLVYANIDFSRVCIQYNNEKIFWIEYEYEKDNWFLSFYEPYASDGCEYLRETNKSCKRSLNSLAKIRQQIEKLLKEIDEYKTAKIKAEYIKDIVNELSTIHKAAEFEGDSVTNALNMLSGGKPIVRIEYDRLKRKQMAFAELEGKRLRCRFPSKLKAEGAFYAVDGLVEQNGCWWVKGEIKMLCK